jgi:hypothetical protein
VANVLTQHEGLNRREAESTWIEWVDALKELRHDYAFYRRRWRAVAIR